MECVCLKYRKKGAWLFSAAEAGRVLSVPTPSERVLWGHRRHKKAAEVRDGCGERWTLAISSASGCMRPDPMNKTNSRSLAAHVRRQKTVGSAAAEDSPGAGRCSQGQLEQVRMGWGSLKYRHLVSVSGYLSGLSRMWVRVSYQESFLRASSEEVCLPSVQNISGPLTMSWCPLLAYVCFTGILKMWGELAWVGHLEL